MAESTTFSFGPAKIEDAPALAHLHTDVANELTRLHGRGPWSLQTSEKSMLFAMRNSQVFVARQAGEIVATLRLTPRKPWAIDIKYFTDSRTPLYLIAMAVTPSRQRQGIGRRCLDEAGRVARSWQADALRLDAFEAKAGAEGFYARCGFTEVGRATYRSAPLIYFELLLS
jgi:GNAT superfamily N-acetyltransferase